MFVHVIDWKFFWMIILMSPYEFVFSVQYTFLNSIEYVSFKWTVKENWKKLERSDVVLYTWCAIWTYKVFGEFVYLPGIILTNWCSYKTLCLSAHLRHVNLAWYFILKLVLLKFWWCSHKHPKTFEKSKVDNVLHIFMPLNGAKTDAWGHICVGMLIMKCMLLFAALMKERSTA